MFRKLQTVIYVFFQSRDIVGKLSVFITIEKKIVSGEYTHEYVYSYKDDFARELESISMPYGLKSTRITDANGRLKERELSANGTKLAHEYYYFRKQGDHGTNQISSVRYGERKNGQYVVKDGISYTYDECGNISEIKENGKLSARYGYDKLNRLIREDNVQLKKTTLFIYDNNGNILSKREAAFTLGDTDKITEFSNEKEYYYDAVQPDRLVAFGDEGIQGYDSIGNPASYRGKNFTWQKGRQLASAVTEEGEVLSFTYDARGRRTGKSGQGEGTKYVYAGDTLIREERYDKDDMLCFGDDLIAGDARILGSVSRDELEYLYGQEGITGLVCNGEKYYFRRNVQGDITRIYALDGTLQACYTYDAWGNHRVSIADGTEIYNSNTGVSAGYEGHIGNINPYRYRGYYYDPETGLYYCLAGTMTLKSADGLTLTT